MTKQLRMVFEGEAVMDQTLFRLSSVLFDELPSLGGLPQQVPEVVRVLLGPALGGGHPGNGAPVGTAERNKKDRKTRENEAEMKRSRGEPTVDSMLFIIFGHNSSS